MPAAHQMEFTFGDADFRTIARHVHKACGIALSDRKRDLVYNRLVRRMRALQFDSFAHYCALLEGPQGSAELGELVNAITTNLTSFFREKHHFDHLRATVLRPLFTSSRNGGRLRIWSSACSTGEEPYSLAMTLRDAMGHAQGWDARILATDIDTNVLRHGSAGVYDQRALENIPDSYRKRYVQKAGPEKIKIIDNVRELIAFKHLNLFDPWPMRGPFDVIFCRNVLIYFDRVDQRKLIDRFYDLLQPQGWLYLGHSESLHGISERFDFVGQTIYRRIR